MNIVEAIRSIQVFDLLVVLGLFAMFVLGYIQGTIRRLLGIASILFSFLLAAQVRDPLGAFLARNWTQFPAQYSYMLGFAIIFGAASVAFSIVIQGFYKRQPLFAKATFVDELLGGLLGIIQGVIILGAVIIILDSFFKIPGLPTSPNELKFLRDLHEALNSSGTAELFRHQLIPAFFFVVGWLIPADVRAFFVS